MASNSNGVSTKRSQMFKMSKKVAELTQVVHMLFTRNHEREVELEITKTLYEEEIQKAATRQSQEVSELRQLVSTLEGERDKATEEGLERGEAKALSDIASLCATVEENEKELTCRIVAINELKEEVRGLRSRLDELRTDADVDAVNATQEMDKASRDAKRLKTRVTEQDSRIEELEARLAQSGRDAGVTSVLLQERVKAAEQESMTARDAAEVYRKETEHERERGARLEADIRKLRNSSNRSDHLMLTRRSAQSTPSPMDTSEEVMRLRAEIQRYRLEISNREGNFNRMFTEKRPIVVGRRGTAAASGAETMGGVIGSMNGVRGSMNGSMEQLGVIRVESSGGYTPRIGSSSGKQFAYPLRQDTNQLPSLGMDMKTKATRLIRAKTLQKELAHQASASPRFQSF